MTRFINNDTIALLALGATAIIGLVLRQSDVSNIALGAIGGFIGSKTLDNVIK